MRHVEADAADDLLDDLRSGQVAGEARQAWRADLLGRLLTDRGRGWVHVNPIPLNPTPGSRWTASTHAAERRFVETLSAHGLSVTVRDTRGREIDGACGQLAATEA